jgi:hypothetical protein
MGKEKAAKQDSCCLIDMFDSFDFDYNPFDFFCEEFDPGIVFFVHLGQAEAFHGVI